jgi:hypothetical protein
MHDARAFSGVVLPFVLYSFFPNASSPRFFFGGGGEGSPPV